MNIRTLKHLLALPLLWLAVLPLPAATVTWVAGSGNWGTATNWSSGQVPGAADDVLITSGGTYTVTINTSAAALSVHVGASIGTQTLAIASTLTGAYMTATGGAQLVAAGGTLNGVRLASDVSITNGQNLYLTNGLTLAGGATITLNSTGTATYLRVNSGTQTIGGNGAIVFAGSATANRLHLGSGGATTLTLGPGVTVRGQGSISQSGGSTLLNQGTIQADVAGKALTITPLNSFINSGTLSASNGAILSISSTWSSSGTVQADNATVNLSGTLNGGVALAGPTGSWNVTGTLNGGTVTATGGAPVVVSGCTFNGVTLASDVSIANGQSLSIGNGLTLAGGATITLNSTGINTRLYANLGTQTIGGNGAIVFAGSGTGNQLYLGNGGATTLTLGPGVTVRGQGSILQSSGSTLINQGTIQADVAGKALTITPRNSFTNSGTLSALNGATLTLSPGSFSNSGTLSASNGAILNISSTWSSSGTVQADNATVNLSGTLNGGVALAGPSGSWNVTGTLNGGTVTATGGAPLVVSDCTLNGVTLASDVSITNGQNLYLANGLTLACGAMITLNSTGTATYLRVNSGTQTIGGNGAIVFAGSGTGNELYLGDGGATTLTLGPGVTVRGQGIISQNFGSTLLNQGTIQADVAGKALIISPNSFTNSGTLKALAGTLQFSTVFNQTAGSTLLLGGTVSASSTMQFLGGTLGGTGTVIASVLNGGTVSPGASPGLLSITGNYTQTTNGTLDIELAGLSAGSGYDRLAVSGTVSLAGALNVTLAGGFCPPANTNFIFVTAGIRTGTFARFSFPSNEVGLVVNYTPTNVSTRVGNVRPVLPGFADQTQDELVQFNLNAAGTDADFPPQTLSYALTNAPEGATINAGTGVISWTPTEAQGPMTTNITVLVTDNGTPNLTVAGTFQITVNEINVAPVLTLPPSQAMAEESAFSATATATDSDIPTNTWAFELVSGPSGLTVTPGGAISWTPTEAQGAGSYPVTVRVTDTNSYAVNEQHLSTTNSFTLEVQEVNRPPVLTVPDDQVLIEQTALSVVASATDPDEPANALTFSLLSPPDGMSIDANTGAISWTPSEAHGPGTNVIQVVVTDYSPLAVNTHLSATNTFTVAVLESNRPPVLMVPTNQAVNELTTLSISALATDPDYPTNALTFALLTPPPGAAIDSTSGLITWTPTEDQGPSTYTLTVTVTDTNAAAVNAKSLSVTNSFTVTVNEVNAAPVVDPIANCTVNAGQTVNITVTATDAALPANVLSFSLVSPPVGATISSGGAFSWRPTVAQAGSSNLLQVLVEDDGTPALRGSNTFSIVVNPLLPVILRPLGFDASGFGVEVSGTSGPDYVVMASTNLTDWADIATNRAPSVPFQFSDGAAGAFTDRSYRIRLVP